jgi:hypothetical protein
VRFGIGHLPCGSRAEFAAAADRAEGLGFDFLAAPDHLGIASPFAGLVAAGMVTRRIRLRTYVLNSCFLNPALLVREAATADLLTDGRLELGLGAGHMKAEFDDAGIPWRRLGARGRRDVDPRTRRGGRPCRHSLLLRSAPAEGRAARRVYRRHERPNGRLVRYVNQRRGGRPYEADMLLQAVQIDVDPHQAASELANGVPGLEPERVLDSPFVLLARDAREAAAELQRRSEHRGFSSITAFWPAIDALRAVRDAVPGRTRPTPEP